MAAGALARSASLANLQAAPTPKKRRKQDDKDAATDTPKKPKNQLQAALEPINKHMESLITSMTTNNSSASFKGFLESKQKADAEFRENDVQLQRDQHALAERQALFQQQIQQQHLDFQRVQAEREHKLREGAQQNQAAMLAMMQSFLKKQQNG